MYSLVGHLENLCELPKPIIRTQNIKILQTTCLMQWRIFEGALLRIKGSPIGEISTPLCFRDKDTFQIIRGLRVQATSRHIVCKLFLTACYPYRLFPGLSLYLESISNWTESIQMLDYSLLEGLEIRPPDHAVAWSDLEENNSTLSILCTFKLLQHPPPKKKKCIIIMLLINMSQDPRKLRL